MKKRNYTLIAGTIMVLAAILIAIIAEFYTPYATDALSVSDKFLSPSLKHIMGTDNLGRDILSRVMVGMGTTIKISGMAILIGGTLGVILGTVSGYIGGFFDEVLMRINDVVASVPSILLAMVFIGVMGRGTVTVTVALGIAFIPSFARVVRGEVMNYRHRDFVKSAKLSGAGPVRIMFLHIMPNIKNTLLAAVATGFNNAVLAEAGMSYMGIGVQPPTPSLGEMLASSQSFWGLAPWYVIFPGLAIIYLVISLVIFSNGLKKNM
ncbi:MAG: ABC transporter permease [Lachnospiraceae bacterium]|nr:ABC transporter permease [Lachnospiraceae bacterium]